MNDLKLFELCAADPQVRISPHCWKTRMALAHKGLRATTIPWHFTDKDAIAASGQPLVPVLEYGDRTISDSWRIAEYLESTFTSRPSLFGNAPAARLAMFVNSWVDQVLVTAAARVILLDVFHVIDERDQPYFRTTREKRFGVTLEQAVEPAEVKLAEFRQALQALRPVLKSQPYLCGDAPAYADYCVFGIFMWSRTCSAIELLKPDDVVHAWRERLLDCFGGMARSAPVARRGVS